MTPHRLPLCYLRALTLRNSMLYLRRHRAQKTIAPHSAHLLTRAAQNVSKRKTEKPWK